MREVPIEVKLNLVYINIYEVKSSFNTGLLAMSKQTHNYFSFSKVLSMKYNSC